MGNRFIQKMRDDSSREEFSNYIHNNFKMILTKTLSESRRRFDFQPGQNPEYLSLMYSILGRFFNEVTYTAIGYLNTASMKPSELIPETTMELLKIIARDETPTNECIKEFLEKVKYLHPDFQWFYEENVGELRENKECEPNW